LTTYLKEIVTLYIVLQSRSWKAAHMSMSCSEGTGYRLHMALYGHVQIDDQ